MSKESALQPFRGRFTVTRINTGEDDVESDVWVIADKKNAAQPVIGGMQFRDGVLINASRSWGNFGKDEAVKAGRALVSALAGSFDEPNMATVSTSIRREPNMTIESVTISRGRGERRFEFSIIELEGSGVGLSIDESIGFP